MTPRPSPVLLGIRQLVRFSSEADSVYLAAYRTMIQAVQTLPAVHSRKMAWDPDTALR